MLFLSSICMEFRGWRTAPKPSQVGHFTISISWKLCFWIVWQAQQAIYPSCFMKLCKSFLKTRSAAITIIVNPHSALQNSNCSRSFFSQRIWAIMKFRRSVLKPPPTYCASATASSQNSWLAWASEWIIVLRVQSQRWGCCASLNKQMERQPQRLRHSLMLAGSVKACYEGRNSSRVKGKELVMGCSLRDPS